MLPFSKDNSLCWDTTFTGTSAKTNVYGSAVSVQLGRLRSKNAGRMGLLGVRFKVEPIAVATAGGYGESIAALISEISRRIS